MTEQKPDYATRAQTIFRIEKNADNPFVMIDRRPIENPVLSWKAKGLLAYLLSRPDNWIVRFADLVKRSPDGGHTVRAAIKELKAAHHLKVTAIREGGRVKQWVYQVYEVPFSPDDDFQQVEKQLVENRTLNDTDLKQEVLTTTGELPIFEVDQLALNAQALYTAITNQTTFPPSWEEKYTRALSDVLTGYFSGEIQTAATSAKPVFTRYCNTRSKGGTKYRPTGTGWLDWWVAELAPKPEEESEPTPSMPQPSEELKARARELFADELAKIGANA